VYHNRYAETSGWVKDSAAFAVKEGDGSKKLVRRTLADGLGIGDGSADDRWLVFREQRSGLEHLRSVAELRERGLRVQLHAYETLVFWEMRELYDSTKHFLDYTWSPDGAVILVQVDDGDEWLYFRPDRAGPIGRVTPGGWRPDWCRCAPRA